MANIIKNETGIYKDRLPPVKMKLGIVIERVPRVQAWYSWVAYLDDAVCASEPGATYGQGDTKEEALYELFDAIAGKCADERE